MMIVIIMIKNLIIKKVNKQNINNSNYNDKEINDININKDNPEDSDSKEINDINLNKENPNDSDYKDINLNKENPNDSDYKEIYTNKDIPNDSDYKKINDINIKKDLNGSNYYKNINKNKLNDSDKKSQDNNIYSANSNNRIKKNKGAERKKFNQNNRKEKENSFINHDKKENTINKVNNFLKNNNNLNLVGNNLDNKNKINYENKQKEKACKVTYNNIEINDRSDKFKMNEKKNNTQTQKLYQGINSIFFYDYQQKSIKDQKISEFKKEELQKEIFNDKVKGRNILKIYYMNYIETILLPLFKKNKNIIQSKLDTIKYNISIILECLGMNKNYYDNYYYQYETKKQNINRHQSQEAVLRFRKEFGISKEDYTDEAIENRLIENNLDINKTFGKMFG